MKVLLGLLFAFALISQLCPALAHCQDDDGELDEDIVALFSPPPSGKTVTSTQQVQQPNRLLQEILGFDPTHRPRCHDSLIGGLDASGCENLTVHGKCIANWLGNHSCFCVDDDDLNPIQLPPGLCCVRESGRYYPQLCP